MDGGRQILPSSRAEATKHRAAQPRVALMLTWAIRSGAEVGLTVNQDHGQCINLTCQREYCDDCSTKEEEFCCKRGIRRLIRNTRNCTCNIT